MPTIVADGTNIRVKTNVLTTLMRKVLSLLMRLT